MQEIADLLGMSEVKRVESYDISNISGFQSVGSMVVFENGKPKRSDYRKFRIKTVQGPDDYASMEEVLGRRFRHGLEERQQIDQGEKSNGRLYGVPGFDHDGWRKGQVNVAESVLRELGIVIPVCGMVKDDRHRTRGLYFQGSEIPVNTCSEGFHLMTRIQDEVHRFAIEYHRSLRSKVQVRSILDDIAGIGAKRRKQLMKRFVSLDAIKAASVEQLAEVESMNEQVAQNVYEFFHKKDS